MKEIINRIFEEKCFTNIKLRDFEFYYRSNSTIRDYYLVQYIEFNADKLSEDLYYLENNFVRQELTKPENIRNQLLENLPDTYKKELDKNLSTIFIVQMSDLQLLENHYNLIYSVEESQRFFKRYVLPYTPKQCDTLKEKLVSDKTIEENLNLLIDNEYGYNDLSKNKYYDGIYSFLVRLFSKIPFIQYIFEKIDSIDSLQKTIDSKIEEESIEEYDAILYDSNHNINSVEDNLLKKHQNILESIDLSESELDDIEEELEELLSRKAEK